jgi:hypothetical protein
MTPPPIEGVTSVTSILNTARRRRTALFPATTSWPTCGCTSADLGHRVVGNAYHVFPDRVSRNATRDAVKRIQEFNPQEML